VGTHVLFPEFAPAHAADGWLTRHLSWPRHEMPFPRVAISPRHATSLGVKEGDRVRLRSRDSEAVLEVRVEKNLRDDVVLVPPHFPEVRQLTEWRLDPVLRDLDLRPGRVSVEAFREDGR
jgi:assimilatory nitrate reductase catalytic subunit